MSFSPQPAIQARSCFDDSVQHGIIAVASGSWLLIFSIIHRFGFLGLRTLCGEMAEWLKVPDSKSGSRETVTGVRIPLSPSIF